MGIILKMISKVNRFSMLKTNMMLNTLVGNVRHFSQVAPSALKEQHQAKH